MDATVGEPDMERLHGTTSAALAALAEFVPDFHHRTLECSSASLTTRRHDSRDQLFEAVE
jgi:hypothetical protein